MKLYWAQVFQMTWANMKSRYRKTFAGLIWVIMNPILMYGAQSLAIKNFLRLELPNFYVFLLGGLLPWIFITQTLNMTAPVIVANGELLKSFKINPKVLLYSQILDNFINFLISFLLLFFPLWLQTKENPAGLIFLPLALFLLLLGTFAIGSFLALLNVFFRDTAFVVNFLTGVLFFLTPIFYPASYIPDKYRFFVELNPFYAFIRPVRSTIYHYDFEVMMMSFGKALLFLIPLLALSIFYWRSKKNALYFYV